MQKINLDLRASFAAKKPFFPEAAGCHVILSQPGSLHAKWDGKEVLIGYGTEFKFRLDQPCELVASVPGVQVLAAPRVVPNADEIFTNMDKRPAPSALERSVTLALRRMRMIEKEHKRRLDAERAKLERESQGEPKNLEPEGEPETTNLPPSGTAEQVGEEPAKSAT